MGLDSRIESLAGQLRDVRNVMQCAGKADPIEHETAYALSEIYEAASKISGALATRFDEALTLDQKEDALAELVQELRHLVYHIEDSVYLNERVMDGL